MANINALGIFSPRIHRDHEQAVEHVMVRRPLQRVLAFSRQSIDDVVNNPLSKNLVRGYYKLYKQIARSSEITELESQWNANGAS